MIIAAAQSMSAPGDVPRNVAHHLQIASLAAEKGVQFLVFPELSLTGYELALARASHVDPNSPALIPLRQQAQKAKMTIVVGAPLRNEHDHLHIAALTLHPDTSVSIYTKEFVHHSEEPIFTSGPGGAPFLIENTKTALAICADATHPQHAAAAASHGAHLYAASVMIDDEGYPRKVALLQHYAQFHHMAVLMANYAGATGGSLSAGKSTIWSEDGHVIIASPGPEEALLIAQKQSHQWTGSLLPL
jgi:predicted amidohydrolase